MEGFIVFPIHLIAKKSKQTENLLIVSEQSEIFLQVVLKKKLTK